MFYKVLLENKLGEGVLNGLLTMEENSLGCS